MAKVVVLGGSGIATPELVDSLAHVPGHEQPVELVLVGRSAHKLGKVAAVCTRLAEGSNHLTVTHSTKVEVALDGADYVINQIRVGGLEARAFDETFPRELGLPGEETVGPGGFANALRTIPVVLEYARLVERAAPQATLLTFTNPSSLVQYAIHRYTSVHSLGLCDSPVRLVNTIAAALGAAIEDLSVDYVGMHHFGWITDIRWRGQEAMGYLLEHAHEIPNLGTDPELVRAMGAIPNVYLRYIFHRDRMLAQQLGKPPRAAQLMDLQEEILAAYEDTRGGKPKVLSQREARWYGAIVVPVLTALMEGWEERHIMDIVNGPTLPWLPQDAIIEVPVILREGSVHPLDTAPVPAMVCALVERNCAYEMLAVEAIVERSYGKALQALLLNPMGLTYDQAKGVLDRIWPTGMPQPF